MYALLNRDVDRLLPEIEKDGGIREYEYLIGTVRSVNITADPHFQRTYRAYWQMGNARLSEDFCARYFEHLEELKEGGDVDVRSVAVRLYGFSCNSRKDRKLHFSFATKLVHMLRPDLPIYDSLIAAFYFLPSADSESFDERLSTLMRSYDFLIAEYARILECKLLAPAMAAFRKRFSVGDEFTDAKVIDTLIWRFAALLRRGAVVNRTITYA